MALVLADRVQDTTTTTGTGTVTLSGSAPTGYQTFGTAIGNANTTYYTIAAGSEWEVGIGTYTAAGTTLSRDTVLASSAGGTTKVTFSAGTKNVFVTYPAESAVYTGGPSATFTRTANATGTLTGFSVTGAADTNLTTATEVNAVKYDLAQTRQWATGAIIRQREFYITAPTYAFVGASTINNAATLGVSGAPSGGTNATLTQSHGFYVPSAALTNVTTGTGAYFVAPTGATNNYSLQWNGTVNGFGDILFGTDATYDIGKSGATRPRDGFFSRNITAGGTLAATGSVSGASASIASGKFAVDTGGALTLTPTSAQPITITTPTGYDNIQRWGTTDASATIGFSAYFNNVRKLAVLFTPAQPWALYNDAAGAYAMTVSSANVIEFYGPVKFKAYTVATLPTAATGMECYVTDALAPTYNTTLVGGGGVTVKAFYNGSNWVAG